MEDLIDGVQIENLTFYNRDANEPVPGFELEPEPRRRFLKTRNPNPNPK
jgi:hypothetical protein